MFTHCDVHKSMHSAGRLTSNLWNNNGTPLSNYEIKFDAIYSEREFARHSAEHNM